MRRYAEIARAVAWRTIHHFTHNPAFLLPSIIFPLFFYVAFAGGLSSVGDVPAFDFPSAYWVARVDADLLKETTNINEKAPWRDGTTKSGKLVGDRVQVAKEYFGTLQMDKLDGTRALAIIESKGGLTLRAVPLP